MQRLYDELKKYGDVEAEVSMSTLTTLRIGGTAAYVLYPKDSLAIMELLKFLKKRKCPYKVFGKGSNLLCSDRRYKGVIIRLDRYFDDYYFEADECVAQAGASIIAVSYEAMKRGKSGLEFASGIPATVGGTIFMNAGAYKSNMADVVKEVLVLKEDTLEWMSNAQCAFGYRHSIFQDHPEWIVMAARYALKPDKVEDIRALIEKRRKRRMDTQPLDAFSAGSVFLSDPERPAWEIIEKLGYRGQYQGKIQVSPKHTNFIVNTGSGKANDFMKLVERIQKDARKQYGIELTMEVERFNW